LKKTSGPVYNKKILVQQHQMTVKDQFGVLLQQKQALKQFVNDECSDAEEINDIKEEIAIQHNNITLAPSCPYVTDVSGRFIKIPKHLYPDIKHAENGGEFKIPGTRYKADGYSPSTKTILEFHGKLYHGCPSCYPPDKYDRNAYIDWIGKSLNQAFEQTKLKKKAIEAAGYRYVCRWDCGHESDLS
jgi:hypothetical protein